MQHKKIVFLASDCESSRWVYHALKKEFELAAVIIEDPVSKKLLLKNRIKRIGYRKVLGQVAFTLLAVPVLRYLARKRKSALLKEFNLVSEPFPGSISRVHSVNDDACREILSQVNPDIIVVNGTRIISKKVLNATSAVFINMHVGITPAYRGSHGGYWALYNNDAARFGTTIHVVDAGVDTGAVLKQVFTKPSKDDNFTTYPILQTAIGINALKEVLLRTNKGDHTTDKNAEKGKMYYQPTLWRYLLGKPR